MSRTAQPHLGLATTEQMFREIISRLTTDSAGTLTAYGATQRALVLAEMLGGLDEMTREYRTVDSR